MTLFDSGFAKAMQEQAPSMRARFLASMYEKHPRDFENASPDAILLEELGAAGYIELARQNLVPIGRIPLGVVVPKTE
jgi:hypothetical protein